MSRQKQQKQPGGFPLPEYATIIRWTVNDVIEWLKQNKLKDSVSCFRLAGVDGNKLMNCIDTDLQGIACPDKEIKMIMNMIKQVDTPSRPFGNTRYNKQKPAAPIRNDSEDDSDNCSWGSDFEDSDGEDYLEPEPQPPAPPPTRGRCPPIPNSSTPPTNAPGRRKPPPPAPPQEEYEDPDQPPPVPAIIPTRSKKTKHPPTQTQNEPQEVYEDPDAPAVSSGNKKGSKGKAPPPAPTKQQAQEEVYEDPEAESPDGPSPPPVPRNIPKRPTIQLPPTPEDYEKPNGKPEPPPNIPRRPGAKPLPSPPANEQEVYEEPDAPSVPTPPRNVPKRGNTKQLPKPPVEQDVYEVPDVDQEPEKPAPPQLKKSQRNPPPRNPAPPPQEEEYEEPDKPNTKPVLPPARDPPKSKSAPKPRVNYTQVDIKLDHRNTAPALNATVSPSVNENLEQQKWYYGDTHRDIIKQRLEQHKTNGMYVIRKSTKSPSEPFTLQIYYDAKVYNLSIRKREDNKYAIGVFKPDERGFSTLLEMINFFKQNFLVLSGGSQTKLLRSLPKDT